VTIKNRVNGSDRDIQEHIVERRSRRSVLSVLTAGLMLGILIAPFLLVESVLAAGAVAAEPCSTCPVEASAAAYVARFTDLDVKQQLEVESATVRNTHAEKSALGAETSSALDSKDEWEDEWFWSASSPARAVRTEMGPASGSEYVWENEWYGVDDPSKIPVNIARSQNAEATSSALDSKDEWEDEWFWSASSPARAVHTEMGPASGSEYVWENEWYGVDDPSELSVNTTWVQRTEIPCGPWTRGMAC
jgi:hypothetical protein